MSRDLDLEEFLSQYVNPQPRPRKPAADIMILGLPTFLGPRLDRSRNGRKRWVTRLDGRPDLKRFTAAFPVL